MKINILSQDRDLIDFCSYLKFSSHEIELIKEDFPSCDLVIYDEAFQDQMDQVSNCVKVCNFSNQKPVDSHSINMPISFTGVDGCHPIKEGCTLSGWGKTKQELISEIAICDESVTNMEIIRKYTKLSSSHRLKVFNTLQPIPLHNYCGILYGNDINNLYRSSCVSLSFSSKTKYRIIESGGTVLTKEADAELPEEFIYSEEEDFHDKVESIISNQTQISRALRDKIVKENNPLTEWHTVFKNLGLKKASHEILESRDQILKGQLL